ncbi:hypothetical protein [Microbulbifer sp. ANSA005]|uniref:hypothetical protein n=1 Tax=Microbulbifer sp. ANSA005 TaxID=3243362 RepID=UPI00404350FE
MLIIQIALGIVLAVVILRFWRQILGFGIIGLIGIALLGTVLTAGYFAYENIHSISPFIGLAVFIGGLVGLVKFFEVSEKYLSKVTVEVWNLSAGDVFFLLFLLCLVVLAFFFFGKAIWLTESRAGNILIGTILFIVTVSGYFIYQKELKRGRASRSAQASYKE